MDAGTGMTYMQQRYYDPQVGRFLSIDPIAANGSTGENFNRYSYANNNPFRFSDPDGRKPKDRGAAYIGDGLFGGGGAGMPVLDKVCINLKRCETPSYRKNDQNSNRGLLRRFFSRKGGGETLEDLDLKDEVMNSDVTRSVMQRFNDQVGEVARKTAMEKGPGSHPISDTFERTYDFKPVRWALGGATLSGIYTGYVDVDSDGSYRYSGNAAIKFFDRFEDVCDVGNNFDGKVNAGGVPYNITGSWVETQLQGRGP